ncbi:MAG: hypothetical protein HXX10_28765, partial [Rhodoplanes sp.]|uniref:hypothetical protein n=1 Tax=Rhodoplanes sp. TaxID=1968906 RepID=UPI001835E0EF
SVEAVWLVSVVRVVLGSVVRWRVWASWVAAAESCASSIRLAKSVVDEAVRVAERAADWTAWAAAAKALDSVVMVGTRIDLFDRFGEHSFADRFASLGPSQKSI